MIILKDKLLSILTLFILVTLLVSGCASSGPDKESEAHLKVLYWDKTTFMQRFGNFMTMEYPNIQIDVVPLKQIYGDNGKNPDQELQKLVTTENFDIIFLKQVYQYDELVKQNLLAPIDHLFKEKSDLNQPVMEKLMRDGALYGYSPSFYADTLYVNKTLFKQQDVQLIPEAESMDWEQFFQILNRFKPETPAMSIGGSAASFALRLGVAQGLTFYSEDRVVIATPGWEKVFEHVRTASQNKTIQVEPDLDPMTGDAFEQGKSAMKFETSDYYQSLELRLESSTNPFEWTVVSFPHNQGIDTVDSLIFHLNEIATIPSQAQNKEQAETFLQFITGEKMTKILQHQGELTTRRSNSTNEKTNHFAYLYDASYTQQAANSYDDIMISIPEQTASKLRESVENVMNQLVMDSSMDTMEGLRQIESETEAAH